MIEKFTFGGEMFVVTLINGQIKWKCIEAKSSDPTTRKWSNAIETIIAQKPIASILKLATIKVINSL